MSDTVDFVVVGAGLMGAAAAWMLARDGRRGVLLESRTPAHEGGSSHGSARIFRRAYSQSSFVDMTGAAADLWAELADEAGENLLRYTGGLNFGPAPGPARLAPVLAACGVAAELVGPAEAESRWPGMVFDGPVLYHEQAGVIDAERAVAAMVRCAAARGTEVRLRSPVLCVEPTGDTARVYTPDDRIVASTVVIAAGAWTRDLVGGLMPMPPLRVTQQQAVHFPRLDPSVEWPTFIYNGEVSMYGLPGGRDGGPGGGIKIGEHDNGTPILADTRSRVVEPGSRRRMIEFVARHLPGLAPTPFNETTCLYTSTETEEFVLNRIGPVVVCSACSGHGAKFAPLIGRMVADLAVLARPGLAWTT